MAFSAKATDMVASAALEQFNRPVAVSIIPSGQKWKDRQQIQYEAMKGLMRADFHGLDDFYEQMDLYSRSNFLILYKAWMMICVLVKRNRKLLMKLVLNPRLGMLVGKLLTKIYGFDKTFALPASILEDQAALKSRLGV